VRFGFVPNSLRTEAASLTAELAQWLEGDGHTVCVPAHEARSGGLDRLAVADDDFAGALDVVVVVGGDGTVLRAVDLTTGKRAPLLSVNMGRLGYLTEVEPAGARQAIESFLAGDYHVERRMTVVGRVEPSGRQIEGLNEIVLAGGEVGRLADIVCAIDDAEFTVYPCDAVVVGTPTGSTAYAFSAGGPIVSPGLGCLVVVPVAAHSLFNRALVLRPDEGLMLRINGERPGAISVDGRKVDELRPGESLRLSAGAEGVTFVRFRELDFLAILREKFGLMGPPRRRA